MKLSKRLIIGLAWAGLTILYGVGGGLLGHFAFERHAWWQCLCVGMIWGGFIASSSLIHKALVNLIEFTAHFCYRHSKDYFIDSL